MMTAVFFNSAIRKVENACDPYPQGLRDGQTVGREGIDSVDLCICIEERLS